MAQQSSGEFASTDPTKGEEDARVQERGIRAKISLNPRSHLQHIQRPAPSHLSKNAPRLQGVGHADVARSRRCGVISAVEPDEPASKFQQRDNALRTTPALLGLFSIVTLWAHGLSYHSSPLNRRFFLPGTMSVPPSLYIAI
jgi:hypothetical protein